MSTEYEKLLSSVKQCMRLANNEQDCLNAKGVKIRPEQNASVAMVEQL